jgi:hypothetical protein
MTGFHGKPVALPRTAGAGVAEPWTAETVIRIMTNDEFTGGRT